jgi:hypothetical protein
VTTARIFVGFTNARIATSSETNASTHHAYIAKKAANTTWQCVTDDGGATETTTNTGVTIVANTFYRLRVELRSGTTPQTICTIDDGTTITRTVVTATQPGSTSAMDVYIKLNQSDNVQKNMDVDYVRAWQDDSPAMVITPDGNLAPALDAIDTENVSEEEVILSETLFQEEAASNSGDLGELVANTVNNFFNRLVEFFGNVIFYADVTFLGRPTFNKDTAGYAVIQTGASEVDIIFNKVYAQNPVVTANVNLVDGVKINEIPMYAVYDISTKGFKIKLSEKTNFELNFSWIALAVNGKNASADAATDTPVSASTPANKTLLHDISLEISTPSVTPSPSQIATQSAAPKAILDQTSESEASSSLMLTD